MDDLLFLSHRIPFPPDKGDKIRAWHILRHLAATHRVHLGCFIDDPADRSHVARLCEVCADVACFAIRPLPRRARALLRLRPGRPLTLDYFRDERLRRWVDAKLAGGAVRTVFAFSAAMAQYAMEARGARRILDMVDVDSQKFAAYAAAEHGPLRALHAREARTLLAFERRAAATFDHTLFVSTAERNCFVALAPEAAARAVAMENGVDLAYFAPDPALPNPLDRDAPAIVFTGAMDYRPNREAVGWFAAAVMPRLAQRRPAPVFYIVGANPAADIRRLAARPDIRVTGRVADTRPYLAHAAVAVAPLRIARGIQNKVLEAMAMARPVVVSSQAFQGVRASPGQDILVADGAEATVQRIGEVLDGLHPALGVAARRAMENGYAWPDRLRVLDALLDAPCGARP